MDSSISGTVASWVGCAPIATTVSPAAAIPVNDGSNGVAPAAGPVKFASAGTAGG